MIKVKFFKAENLVKGFEVSGHSGSAEKGKDVICAFVSSACLMTANTIPEVIGLSKNTVKIIRENFAMAIGINSFALVLGATGILPAIYSSVIHNLSTVLVVGNSLRLLKYKLKS